RAIIQQEGYSFLVGGDGDEALTLSRAYPDEIHLLLTDVQMPKINGLFLVAEIIKQRPAIRILVMTGEASDEIRSANIKLLFLRKPFTPKPFLERVRQVLQGPPAARFGA